MPEFQEITHPFANQHKSLVIPQVLLDFVAELPALPTTYRPALRSPYWGSFVPTCVDDLVPAGTYTDPDTDEALEAVEALYLHLGGKAVTRHMIAVVLNFQDYRYVDAIRDRLAAIAQDEAAATGQPVTPPWTRKPGQRSHAYRDAQPVVADVIAAQAAKQVAKAS